MANKLMTKIDTEDCIFERLDVDNSNFSKYEDILNLPYAIYVEVINRICSGELNIEDFDRRLFKQELKQDYSAILPELTLDDNIAVTDALVKDFKKKNKNNNGSYSNGGVYTNHIYEANKKNFTGSYEGDVIAVNAMSKLNGGLRPGLNDLIIKKDDDDEIKKEMSLATYIEPNKFVDILLNGRNKKFALDTPEMKQLNSELGLLKRKKLELEKRSESNTMAEMIAINDRVEIINRKLKMLNNDRKHTLNS